MEHDELKAIFGRYLQKIASPEEVKALLSHFHLDKASDSLTEMILEELQQPTAANGNQLPDEAQVYERVEQALHIRIGGEQKVLIVPIWRKAGFSIAASIAIILVLFGGYFFLYKAKPITMLTAHADYGKLVQLSLPDSSKVWLNSGSQVTYPEKFGEVRTVVLDSGEAYFEVVHDPLKPFIVHAARTNVTVLGTSFEVSSFTKEARITVSSGKVGIQAKSGETAIFLYPGERAAIEKANYQVTKSSVNISDIASWREHKLVFDDQPLSEVIRSLERKYNVRIRIENNQLLSEKVTMKLENESLNDVLTTLSFAKHFNYTQVNEKLVLIK